MNNYDKRMDQWTEKTFGSNQYGDEYEERGRKKWDDFIDPNEQLEELLKELRGEFLELETEREK